MKKVLLDTNVVLDVLLERKPHVSAATKIWAAIENQQLHGFLSAHAITTIYYVTEKERGAAVAMQFVNAILRVFSIAPVTGDILQEASRLAMPDFEDSVTAAAADFAKCGLIVTRDPRGFWGSPVRCLPPEAALLNF